MDNNPPPPTELDPQLRLDFEILYAMLLQAAQQQRNVQLDSALTAQRDVQLISEPIAPSTEQRISTPSLSSVFQPTNQPISVPSVTPTTKPPRPRQGPPQAIREAMTPIAFTDYVVPLLNVQHRYLADLEHQRVQTSEHVYLGLRDPDKHWAMNVDIYKASLVRRLVCHVDGNEAGPKLPNETLYFKYVWFLYHTTWVQAQLRAELLSGSKVMAWLK